MRHTRKEVIARTRREFAELDRVVRRLRPADWKLLVPRPPSRDPWTVKDALCHIVYWKEHTTRVFRGEPRPLDLRGLDIKRLNRVIHERWRGRRPSEVVAWHRRVHTNVLKMLAKTPDEWFARREHSKEWPLDFDGHSAVHRMKDIEAAISAAAATPRVGGARKRRVSRGTSNQR